MPGVDDTVDPLPPEPFSGWWLAGGIVLAVVAALLVAWPWISRWLRSRRPAGPPEPAPPAEPVADGAGAAR
ncbi:MAG: hypothetical protein LBG60_02355, partial [Bifidobacteriaceae bacterium]|nr:hypothetical protein [Bifidobacteriaceae bacterium]